MADTPKNAPPERPDDLQDAVDGMYEQVGRQLADVVNTQPGSVFQHAVKPEPPKKRSTPENEANARGSRGIDRPSNRKNDIKVGAEIKRHPGWYVLAFILWGLPLGLGTIWPMVAGSKTLPEWLAEHGWPRLMILFIAWVVTGCIIAVVIIARSYITATAGRRNSSGIANIEIARKLKEYQDIGQKLLKECAGSKLPNIVWMIDWQGEVEAYIRENVGAFQAIEFSKSAPLTVYPHPSYNEDLTNKIYTQTDRIGQIISELRPS